VTGKTGRAGSLAFIGWSLAVLLALLHAWLLNRYAVNFPFQDDYTQLLVVPGYFDRQAGWVDKIAYVFSLSVEHRIATFRLLALIQAKLLGQLDFRALIFFGNALCVAAGLLVLSRADAAQRPWLAPLFAALLLSPTNMIAQYWTTGALQHLGGTAYAFGALFCALRRGPVWTVGAFLFAAAAAFTVVSGLMVFPVAAAMMWLTRRPRAAVAWAVVTLAFFGLYFIGYETPIGSRSMAGMLRDPLRLAWLGLSTLGSLTGEPLSAGALGAVLVAAWFGLFALRRERSIAPELIAWMAFVVLCSAAIAAGRAALGPEAVINSRYRVYSEMAALVTLLAVLAKLDSLRWSKVFVAVLLPCSLLLFARAWDRYVPSIADLAMESRNARDHYLLDGHGVYYTWPPQDFGDFALKRAADDGYFRPSRTGRKAAALAEATLNGTPASPPGFWAATPIVDANAITVRGVADARDRNVALFLRSRANTYVAALPTQRMFRRLGSSDQFIFWGVVPLRGAAPGRYQIGYVLRDKGAAEVISTDAWVDVT
jgi:hypothetical protein